MQDEGIVQSHEGRRRRAFGARLVETMAVGDGFSAAIDRRRQTDRQQI
jgi:hypothetical protein